MRKTVLPFVLILLLLCSCELVYEARNPAPSVGTMRVLVYGNDYDYSGMSQYHLEGTVNDAVQVGMALTELARKAGVPCQTTYLVGKDTEGIRNVITGEFAVFNTVTKAKFCEELGRIASESEPQDIVVVFFAGHGKGSPSKVSYGTDVASSSRMVMNNTANNNLEELADSDFLDMMQSIKGTKVILGDFCYSGALVPSSFVSVGTNEFNDMDINDLFGNRDRIDVDPSLYVLSAARYSEKSYSKRNGTHGFFTAALLEALGWDEDLQCLKASPVAKNGMITLHNIARYVIKNDDNSSQNPMFSGGSNDLVLFSFR